MSGAPSSPTRTVPSVRIFHADETFGFFEGEDDIHTDLSKLYTVEDQTAALHMPYTSGTLPGYSEDIFSCLSTMTAGYDLEHTLVSSHSTIPRDEDAATSIYEGHKISCGLRSPTPPPLPSSPSSFYDSALCDIGPYPIVPTPSGLHPTQEPKHWSSGLSTIESFPDNSDLPYAPVPQTGLYRTSMSLSPRRGPVASKAMLEANSRRHRHPAQFQCTECNQTFTALFSLKRHAQSHTGERPFECSIPGCGQRFYNALDCKRHEKSKKRHKDLLEWSKP